MCAIAGIIASDSRQYRRQLGLMTKVLAHRGPDGPGQFFFPDCALGHDRLSIIDLTTGDQPMVVGRLGLVFNGEIYGYQEIRKSLSKYHFQTTSDTEVILALYQKYGTGMLKYLPGMFAFALWDQKTQVLFCARDRFGEKPFYYAFGPRGEFIFASEIKGILASGLVKPVLDPASVSHYLKHLYVHPGQTIYKNIYCLPPSHQLVFKAGKIKVQRYWSPILRPDAIGLTEAAEKFKTLFFQAVEKQLVADVPVGLLLSGGLDSSSVLAAASTMKSKIKTFSFGFEGGRNELPFARETANFFQTDHHEFFEKDVNISNLLLTMAKVYDEPFADSSNIPTYLIAKLASKYVKVALAGDGGDELLGGYSSWYRPLVSMTKRERFFWPKLVWLQALSFGHVLARAPFSPQKRFELEGLKWRWRFKDVGQAHDWQLSYFSDVDLASLGLPPVDYARIENIDRLLQEDVQNYMAGDILVKTDRASMASGLELRAPFLDRDLATFCLQLPFCLKVGEESDKILLREVMKDRLPASIFHRGKRGFGAPIEKWLTDPGVVALQKKFLPKMPFRNPFQRWILLNLAIWMAEHHYDIDT